MVGMKCVLDTVIGAGLGAVATLGCAWIARRVGLVQISIMRQAHSLNVAKAVPQIGCEIIAKKQQDLPTEYNPHIYITVKIYNEGELPVQNLDGQWTLLASKLSENYISKIQRDFLGKCENLSYTHKIQASADWIRAAINFDVNIEFTYLVPGEDQQKRYRAQYRYDRESEQLLKIDNEIS
jgi:hypothetical protein